MTAERTETDVPHEAPTTNLPAIHQDRAPRLPRQTKAKPAQYPPKIAAAMLKIMREMDAIEKAGEHSFHHYYYPRWEDVSNALSPLLMANGLLIVQQEVSRDLLEKGEKGSVLAIVYHFTIVNEEGESWPPIEWTAIARLTDQKGITDDKAASKCHTSAEKFFSMKAFKIRTKDLEADDTAPTLPKKDARELYSKLQAEIDGQTSAAALGTWGKDIENVKRKKLLPPDWQDIITGRYNEKMAELQGGPKVVWDDDMDPLTGEVRPHPGYKPDPMPD
jgi:hypothetical protein